MNDTEPAASPVYFGEPWGIFALHPDEAAKRVATPLGDSCLTCKEAIAEGDRGFIRTVAGPEGILTAYEVAPVHAECDALSVVGHLFGVCSCTGYDTASRSTARVLWQRIGALANGIDPALPEEPR